MRSDSQGNIEANAEADGASDVDLSRIGRALLAKRWWVMGPTFAALIGAAIFVTVVKPRYGAETRLLLENQENFLKRADKGEHYDPVAPDAEAVQSQIQLLTSRDLARRVIKTLELQGNEEFDPLAKGMGAFRRALVLLGISRDPTTLSPEDRILETFADKLAVLSPTKTRVLSVEFSSRDPDLAAKGANAVADAYIEMQQDAKRENARAAAKSLGALVADLKTRVGVAEERVEQFRVKSGLLVGTNNATITTQQLGEMNNQLSISRTAAADAQAKAKILREMLIQHRIGDIPDVSNNELIRRINEQRVTFRAQMALESRTLLPGHPRIKELTAQLANLDLEWRSAAERTARTLDNDARIAGARVENLARALDEQKKVAGAAGSEEVRLHELERAARLLKDQLEAESVKYQEALARESVKTTPADARVIQRALAPQLPAFPKKIPITAFVTLAALILSVGAVVSGELLSGRAQVRAHVSAPRRAPETAPITAPAPVAASGVEPPEPPAPPPPPPRQAIGSEAVGKIDAARQSAQCVKVLAVGGGARTGQAAVIELARALARRGRAILAVADPADAAYDRLVASGGEKPMGLADLMAGDAVFADVIHRDKESRLHVTPAGSNRDAERHDIAHDIAQVIDALARTYDFVILATATPRTALRLAPLFDMALVQGDDRAAETLRDELSQAGLDASLVEAGDGAMETSAAA